MSMTERYELALERIGSIAEETFPKKEWDAFFKQMTQFLQFMDETYRYVGGEAFWQAGLQELQQHNRRLYADILPENYAHSYANPAYAVSQFGEEYGRLLCFLYGELRSMIVFAYEQKEEELTIRMELFLEIYNAICYAWEDTKDLPKAESIRQIEYWFISDYSDIETEQRIREQLCPEEAFAVKIMMESDLSDVRFLYRYGEYVTDTEIQTVQYLQKLPKEKLKKIADTYTEGYRIGFVTGGKDLSRKKTVDIRYRLGFEPVVRQAVLNFEKMGLQPVIHRAAVSAFHGKSIYKNGFFGAIPNKQYDYDHKEDAALFLDKMLINRKLEVLQTAYEEEKEWAAYYAGPACIETFGEVPFAPANVPEACHLSEEQQKLSVEYASGAGDITNRYIKGEERSFTIIAFPIPEIGNNFEEIFEAIAEINTLDYKLYQSIQQTLIATLDMAEKVVIKGMRGNRTDLQVMLASLSNPDKETKFENCVADVNIPVGEVFTSPRLQGTDGVLHVSRVFLHELEYKNLEVTFKNGMVTEYGCSNFDREEENRRYVKENVLYHHEALPMGEFAIGTNTTAYVVSEKFGIADKLPILIAEKMGPHFAVGDTCYSHGEDLAVYNPDGKEMIARDNEVSLLRKTDRSKAYFNCHTDITLPYDELGELSVITAEGVKIPIILNGRFVLKGCEELNRPFENTGIEN